MATSNSTDWSLNRNQVISGALRKLGVLPSGGTATSNQISDAADALNAIVKAFQADGMPLWKVSSQAFTVVDGTSSYTVGPSQTINCPKPLRILQAFWTPTGGTNTPLNVYTRYDFNELPQGSTYEGDPVNLYYQPLRTTGVIKLWPTPDNSTTSITFHYISPFEDMDNSTDDFDFPSEWMQAIIYNLAWALAPEYGIPPVDREILRKEAQYWHQKTLEMGSEEGSMFLQPDWSR
jgi:hypothetical protein